MKIKNILYKAIRYHAEKLKDIVLKHDDVINNCVSTSQSLPLSALQGKLLQDQIDAFKDGAHFRKYYLQKGEHLFSIDNNTMACLFGCMANPTPKSITRLRYYSSSASTCPDIEYSYMLPFAKFDPDFVNYTMQSASRINNKQYIGAGTTNGSLKVTVSHDNGANILFIILCGDVTLNE